MRNFIMAFVLVAVGGPGLAGGPSFNCSGMLSQTQAAICADPILGDLDMEHEKLFSRLSAASDRGLQARMARDYDMWWRFRDLCGPDRACIAHRYEARVSELKASQRIVLVDPARPVIGRITGVLQTTQPTAKPQLRVLGEALIANRRTLDLTAVSRLERNAVLAARGADPAPPPPRVRVTDDGTIEKAFRDGSVAIYNPITGQSSLRTPDGRIMTPFAMTVESDELPALPGNYAGWSASVSASLSGLVGNLLTETEVQTLQSSAPVNFFDNLDYQLGILAFITS